MKIEKILAYGFRGIPSELVLDFRTEYSTTPCSLILSGDNGTGKSSLIDAIEFALQARIARSRVMNIESKPYAASFSNNDKCFAKAWLDNGDVIERNIVKNETGLEVKSIKPHADFRISPFVLRRSDILQFIDMPEVKRQTIFLDYLKLWSDESDDKPDDMSQELSRQRLELKNVRRNLHEELAGHLGVPSSDIPVLRHDFDEFVRKKIHLGITRKMGRDGNIMRGGIQIEINPQVKRCVEQIGEVRSKISDLNRRIKVLNKGNVREPKLNRLRTVLGNMETRLTDSFKRISTSRFIDKIELAIGDISEVSLSIRVHLHNGTICSPKQVFSEANMDLLALLIFFAVLKESAELGQAKFLVLDDVLQSVDSSIRVMIADYVLQDFSDWQLVFTVHDRLWRTQLCDLFRRHGHPFVDREIIRWEFDEGPTILGGQKDIGGKLSEAIERGDILNICSQAGRLLEAICNTLSWTLEIPVIRRKDDRYTLGDLWPGIYKVLSKTNVADVADRVSQWTHLRNLVGAHYNEWAESVSLEETNSFGRSVLELLNSVKCPHCYRWIEKTSQDTRTWGCKCSKTVIKKE